MGTINGCVVSFLSKPTLDSDNQFAIHCTVTLVWTTGNKFKESWEHFEVGCINMLDIIQLIILASLFFPLQCVCTGHSWRVRRSAVKMEEVYQWWNSRSSTRTKRGTKTNHWSVHFNSSVQVLVKTFFMLSLAISYIILILCIMYINYIVLVATVHVLLVRMHVHYIYGYGSALQGVDCSTIAHK